MFEPAYLRLRATDELALRAGRAREILAGCVLCPRECHVDRLRGDKGICKTGSLAVISSYGPHLGEERPLVGRNGSGTIFFTHCSLCCSFCQNYDISHYGLGREERSARLAEMMLELQALGCHNINFVTPTHVVPQILEALGTAIEKGLKVPLVYNCGGYEKVETLRLLDGVFDIYMPDFKFAAPEVAGRFCDAPDYPVVAKAALMEMHRQVGDLSFDQNGIALRGLLVRHLVLPGGLAGTREVMEFLAESLSPDTYVNVMEQYRPCHEAFRDPPMDRPPTSAEFEEALRLARQAGLSRIDRDWRPG
jgi:putative pyruvate formate lyase activating enzyme